ncbi:beta-1,3-galactosyltransferase 1-like [Pocillopora damicornis]|uniref:beta-1,3-galactosyltransferase 1-like n=1 Tax=Pocillopora damicornis TaxID=46731 RepID=UPI000F55587B|nr:beta-1,3-galactosyltransferase 1-like [Pocillopora damicornis]
MLNIKRLKPFVLVISMLCFCVMGVLTIFFSRYENKVRVSRNLPQATKQSAVSFDLKTSLDHLRNSFEMSLDQYNYSTRNFSEKFREARLRSELFYRKLDSRSKRHFVCNNGLFLLIQVHSSPANFKSRQGIRLTWGNMERFIGHDHQDINRNYTLRSWKTVFLIGQSSDPRLNDLVLQEANIYKDIMIGSFKDTYRNLNMKMIFSLKWPLEQKCRVSYILKTDEDCYVNIWNLLHWLRSYHEANGSRPLYAGRVQTEMPVVRDTKSRYYVSEEDHPADIYKPYASGGGYVISASLLPALVNVSRTSPIFANEDALLGSLMYRIGIQWTDNQKFLPLIFCSHLNKYRFRDMHMCGLSRQIILHGIRGRLQLEMHFNSALYNHFPSLCSSHMNYEDMRDVCE